MKIAILRFSSIGDIVLTTPVIRNLKAQVDKAEVHYVTKKQYAGLLKENPYLDGVHVLDGGLWNLIAELRKQKFDWIIDLHHNLRTLIIKTALNTKSKSFNKLNIEKWWMVNFKINKLPSLHIVDRYMETVKHLGVTHDALGLDFFIPKADEVPRDWLPETHQDEYVIYAIGGQHATKRLPLKRMIELCDKINKPVVLIGGRDDAATAEEIKHFFEKTHGSEQFEQALSEMGKKTVIYNACGKYNVNQSASLIKGAKYIFTHDTGMMHIAAAFRREVFSIWGNTIPAFGMYPYRTRYTILENNKLDCRPCSKIGYNKCPKGHFNCMNKIVFDFYLP